MNQPENIVSNIAQTVADGLAGVLKPSRPKIDVNEVYRRIYDNMLRDQKYKPTRTQLRLAKMQRAAYRNRVKMPVVADLKVVDTGTNQDRTRMYFELSNGQIVRANRSVSKNAGRRLAFHSLPLRDIVVAEVEKNANRKAA